VLKSRATGHRYEWLIEADGPAKLQAATHYYPGWRLTVDGDQRPITIQNPYGLIHFTLEAGRHQVVLAFGSTLERTWAAAASAAALVLLLGRRFWAGLAAYPGGSRSRANVNLDSDQLLCYNC